MFDNDHTEAEAARREHAYEMGDESQTGRAYGRWIDKVEALLIDVGATTEQKGVDGYEFEDGFSLDSAGLAFERGLSPQDYFADVLFQRGKLGFRDGDAA